MRVAITVTILIGVLGCAHSHSSQDTQPLTICNGTPVLRVRNNTRGDIEVYEYRAGVRNVIATVPPGSYSIVVSGEAGLSYGAQALRRNAGLRPTKAARPRDTGRAAKRCPGARHPLGWTLIGIGSAPRLAPR